MNSVVVVPLAPAPLTSPHPCPRRRPASRGVCSRSSRTRSSRYPRRAPRPFPGTRRHRVRSVYGLSAVGAELRSVLASGELAGLPDQGIAFHASPPLCPPQSKRRQQFLHALAGVEAPVGTLRLQQPLSQPQHPFAVVERIAVPA